MTDAPAFCCSMREYFLLVPFRNPAIPKEPKEVVDFLEMGEKGPALRTRFCPWCGKPLNGSQPFRMVHAS